MSAKPRVLMATDVPSGQDTGMGRHQWFLARELQQRGFVVHELYSEDVPECRPRGLRRFTFPWAVLREAQRAHGNGTPYEVALVHEGSASLLCLARRLRLLPTICVVVSHNPEQKVWEHHLNYARRGRDTIRMRSRISWPLTRLLQSNLALRLADWIVCLSEEDRRFIATRYRTGAERTKCIANGVEARFFLEPRPAGPARILFLGTWLPHKGTAALREALPRILQQFPDALASLMGVGFPEASVLSEFPAAIHERLCVRCHFPPESLSEILASHNVFVLPSWWEGMPLSLLEAMAAGLAVIVSDVGGMRDVVREGKDGLRVPADDPAALCAALERVCADVDLRQELGAAARARASVYTWAHAGERLAEVLRNILHGGVEAIQEIESSEGA